jgi:ElaB/YqjD/DUF883 family membrane-anchored ribosome-binding protein
MPLSITLPDIQSYSATFIIHKKNHIMANNIDDILDEGKKHLIELQKQLESLAGTAEKVAGAKTEELIAQAKVHAEEAQKLIDSKSKEVMESDQYKTLEAEGKKLLDDAQVTIADLSTKATEMADEFSAKLKSLLGNK